MQAKINNSLLKSLSPQSKPYEVRDANLKGFILRVQPSGVMSFNCEYKRGKRIVLGKVGVMTCAQAREKAMEILSDASQGIDPQKNKINERITLKSFLETDYIPWMMTNHKRANKTLATINRCFEKLFQYSLTEITPSVIERWRIKRINDGVANATINRDVTTIRSILTRAYEWEIISINPLSKLKTLKIDQSPKVRYLSQEEETQLRLALAEREAELKKARVQANEWRLERGYSPLDEFDEKQYYDHLMPMVLISINTGWRQGELFNLAWNMVDLNQKSLIVTGDITKNSSSRYIPLNDEVLAVFKKLYDNGDNNGLVFPSKDNKPFNTVKRSWGTLLKKAKIEQFRWHDLRHHFASKLVMAGVDLNTVRELLGHSDIKTTLRYAHLAPEHKISAVQKICFK